MIVYHYSRSQPHDLVYVAMSRATRPEGLFIVSEDGDKVFDHGLTESRAAEGLRNEFKRLNEKQQSGTVVEQFKNNFMRSDGLMIFCFNVQSITAHVFDLNDEVFLMSDIALLNETRLENDQQLTIEGFSCAAQYQRPNHKSGGVAIYNNINETNIGKYEIHLLSRTDIHSKIGDVCSDRCTLKNNTTIVIASIYISPNSSVTDVKSFLAEALTPYAEEKVSFHNRHVDIDKGFDTIPFILGGDFNIDFSQQSSAGILKLLEEDFNLIPQNNLKESTTGSGTCINAIFSSNIEFLKCEVYTSYFSYQKPIIALIQND